MENDASIESEESKRRRIFTDARFWTRLEFGLCGAFRRSPDRNLWKFWIDGFIPESLTNTCFGADLEGWAWVAIENGGQERYRFTVSVPQKLLYRMGADYEIAELALEEEKKKLQVKLIFA